MMGEDEVLEILYTLRELIEADKKQEVLERIDALTDELEEDIEEEEEESEEDGEEDDGAGDDPEHDRSEESVWR